MSTLLILVSIALFIAASNIFPKPLEHKPIPESLYFIISFGFFILSAYLLLYSFLLIFNII